MEVFAVSQKEFESLKEVTSRKIFKSFTRNRVLFHPEGLYSEQIFGPVQDFVCQCPPGDINVVRKIGEVCPKCGVEITSSLKRRTTFAKITLPFPVITGAFYVLLKSLRNNVFYKMFENLVLKGQVANVFNLQTGKIVDEIDKISVDKLVEYETKSEEHLVIVRDVLKLIDVIVDYYTLKYKTSLQELVEKNLIENSKLAYLLRLIAEEKHLTDTILVLPPAYRPILLGGSQSSSNVVLDDITKAYLSILNEKSVLERFENILDSEKIRAGYVNSLNYAIVNLYEAIITNLKGKEGILRSLLKRRVDWSIRGVIVPVSGDTNVVYVPRNALLEVFKIDIAGIILSREKNRNFVEVIDLIEKAKSGKKLNEKEQNLINEALEQVVEDSLFILNRQPTLHRGSMWAVKIKPWSHPVIGLPKLLCEPLNADFDGDTVALYRVTLNKDLVRLKMSPSSKTATVNPQDLTSYLKAKQDIIYALYLISKDENDEYYSKLEEVVGKEVLEKYKPLNKEKLSKLFTEIHSTTLFNKILEIADEYTEKHPITMSILDFEIPSVEEIVLSLSSKNEFDSEEEVKEKMTLIKEVESIVSKEFNLSDVIKSGARGSFSQVRQIVGVRGYVSDIYGREYRKFIAGNYSKGLTPEELYVSAKGTRKALLDQDITIAKSGYLYRKLVYNSSFVFLSDERSCNHNINLSFTLPEVEELTKTYLKCLLKRKLFLDKENYVIVDRENVEQLSKELLGKKVYLHSPITCDLEKGICKDCYPLDFGSRQIGLISAQSVSERLTQTSLRTFHTGGVARGKSDVVNILDVMNKYFDSTHEYQNFREFIYDMLDHWLLMSEFNIQLIHFEVINSARLYVVIDDEEVHVKEYVRNYLGKKPKKIILYGVSKIPYMRSKTLGLIFEDAVSALANMIVAERRDDSIFDELFLKGLL